MKTINMLGNATENTKGTQFHSVQNDPVTEKIFRNGQWYCTWNPDEADGIEVVCTF